MSEAIECRVEVGMEDQSRGVVTGSPRQICCFSPSFEGVMSIYGDPFGDTVKKLNRAKNAGYKIEFVTENTKGRTGLNPLIPQDKSYLRNKLAL